MNFLSRAGFVGHIVAFSIAGLILAGACFALFKCTFEISRKHSSSPKVIASLIATILAAAAVIAATSFPPGTNPGKAKEGTATSRSQGAPLLFLNPHPAYPGNPLPTVACVQEISITGHMPTGDVLVTGNQAAGSSGYYFLSVDQATNSSNSQWNIKVDFGNDKNAGTRFHLVAFALPSRLSSYLNGLYAALGGTGGGWDYGTLPPGSAELVQEDVRRMNDKCPKY